MEKIIRTITKKCPCGYTFTENQTIEKRSIRKKKQLSLFNDSRYEITHEDKTIKSEIIDGNQEFIEVSFLNGIDMVSQDFKRRNFIICPKCGTLLCTEIATEITEKKA